ncbi:unnamed protein product [Paramecium sonneborni]|uniref:Uncharacterized protein n=1 Tax=Paramecium sonneborni TaxID=65129 RepID=A0A8S1MLS7_9CILI|nr:unnamed protein product [Paramecium sonneborni]
MQTEQEQIVKLLLTGSGAAGKSAFMFKYTENMFTDSYLPTIGVDFKVQHFELNGKAIKAQIWDCAGQERFMTITSSYFKGAHGIFIFYDVTDKQSFNDIQKWLDQADKFGQASVPKMLIGNKTDLKDQRQITFEEGKQFADASGMSFLEISVKDGLNVQQAILSMTLEILAEQEKNQQKEQIEKQ